MLLTIIATTPPNTAGVVNVVITTPNGTATGTGAYIYAANPPSVTSIIPNTGTSGATVLVTNLAGTNFVPGSTTSVLLEKAGESDIVATNVNVVSSTKITCTFTLPAPTVTSIGAWNVVVVNEDTQSGVLSNGFTIIQPAPSPAPSVTSISPNTGTAGNSVAVTLAGTNFVTGSTTTAVWLAKSGSGNITATGVTVNSASQITCTFPLPAPSSMSAGQWDVAVRNPDYQTGSLGNAFTVVNPPIPTVTGISPVTGPIAGGTTVTITGTNLAGATAVTFGTTAATYTVTSATSITATSPAGSSAGIVDITVTTPGGISATSPADQFTYKITPIVTSISPNNGYVATSVTVTIAGSNFIAGSTVVLQKSDASPITATGVIVNSASQITCTFLLPPMSSTSAGQWDIVVTDANGSGTLPGAFQVKNIPPTLTSISPTSGYASSLMLFPPITITGTNFVPGTQPTIWMQKGSVKTQVSLSVTVQSSTQMTAGIAVPLLSSTSADGLWDVIIINADGQTATLPAIFQVINPVPTVTSISPTSGVAGTTVPVTISGTSFVIGTTPTVWLARSGSGNITATGVSVSSPTQITCTLPASRRICICLSLVCCRQER